MSKENVHTHMCTYVIHTFTYTQTHVSVHETVITKEKEDLTFGRSWREEKKEGDIMKFYFKKRMWLVVCIL